MTSGRVVPAQGHVLAADLGFVEGPTVLQSGTVVVVSLDHQRVYATHSDGVDVLAELDAAPNGATEAADGTLYLATFSGAWPARDDCRGPAGVFALRPDGTVDSVTREPQAPNDLCFGPEGNVYVTDPKRGDTVGSLWRVDVTTGEAATITTGEWYPNGVGFDADDTLWVADTYGRRMVTVGLDGAVTEAFRLHQGRPDGFAFDMEGNIVVCAPGTPEDPEATVQLWTTGGELVGLLLAGGSTHYTNVAIGGDATAYVTEAQHGRVLALPDACAPGLPLHPFR